MLTEKIQKITNRLIGLLLVGIVAIALGGLGGYGVQMQQSLYYSWAGNSLGQLLVAVIVFFVVRVVVELFNKRAVSWLKGVEEKKWIKSFSMLLVHYLVQMPQYFLISLYVFLPLKIISLPPLANTILDVLIIGLVVLQGMRLVTTILIYAGEQAFTRDGKIDDTTVHAVHLVVNILVWSVGILMFLMNSGVEVSPLLASLGIGGIAIAFALQNVLQDLFASFSLFLDRPFKIGDYIVVGTDEGTVKDITFKSTRVETLHGQELTIPNREVMNTRINNFERMRHRRVTTHLQVVYETSPAHLKAIPHLIHQVIKEMEGVRFGRCHFKHYTEYSLKFELIYFVLSGDYTFYMDRQHDINIAVFEKFSEQGIKFAYPTQMIYTKSADEEGE